jgi:hypothetical protein
MSDTMKKLHSGLLGGTVHAVGDTEMLLDLLRVGKAQVIDSVSASTIAMINLLMSSPL